eukprot:6465055-Amphidinium_carterae.1
MDLTENFCHWLQPWSILETGANTMERDKNRSVDFVEEILDTYAYSGHQRPSKAPPNQPSIMEVGDICS